MGGETYTFIATYSVLSFFGRTFDSRPHQIKNPWAYIRFRPTQSCDRRRKDFFMLRSEVFLVRGEVFLARSVFFPSARARARALRCEMFLHLGKCTACDSLICWTRGFFVLGKGFIACYVTDSFDYPVSSLVLATFGLTCTNGVCGSVLASA